MLRSVNKGSAMSDEDTAAEIAADDRGRITRRSALFAMGAGIALSNAAVLTCVPSVQAKPVGSGAGALRNASVDDIVRGGGSLVVAQWEAKEGQAEAVAGILRRFLPQAQSDPGAKLFLIARGKDNSNQFVFYELFVDDAAIAAHRASDYFKTLIVGEALPLLSKRESEQYSLL
jgi:quinol monooxygenase YgiN